LTFLQNIIVAPSTVISEGATMMTHALIIAAAVYSFRCLVTDLTANKVLL